MQIIPVIFNPLYKAKVWGADNLKKLFGKDIPDNQKIGESWELADLKQGQSTVAGPVWQGLTTRQMLDKYGTNLGFTPGQCRFPFGLLIKFLDANDVLSVQVHPDAHACKKYPDAQLKTECWYVIDAQPDAVIYRGLKDGIGRNDMEQAIKKGTVDKLLRVYPAKKGDFHYIPAGTVHALGAGVVVAEIQTPSDTTYRLYDWNRRDAQGRSRELHISHALDSIHYTDGTSTTEPESGDKIEANINNGAGSNMSKILSSLSALGQARPLLNCPFFSVLHLTIPQAGQYNVAIGKPFVMITLQGSGSIYDATAKLSCSYKAGDTVLWPIMPMACLHIAKPVSCLITCLEQA